MCIEYLFHVQLSTLLSFVWSSLSWHQLCPRKSIHLWLFRRQLQRQSCTSDAMASSPHLVLVALLFVCCFKPSDLSERGKAQSLHPMDSMHDASQKQFMILSLWSHPNLTHHETTTLPLWIKCWFDKKWFTLLTDPIYKKNIYIKIFVWTQNMDPNVSNNCTIKIFFFLPSFSCRSNMYWWVFFFFYQQIITDLQWLTHCIVVVAAAPSKS